MTEASLDDSHADPPPAVSPGRSRAEHILEDTMAGHQLEASDKTSEKTGPRFAFLETNRVGICSDLLVDIAVAAMIEWSLALESAFLESKLA